jgi:hypothetical protein
VKFNRFGKTKGTCFLSYVEDITNTNESLRIHTYKYKWGMFPKVGLFKETKRGVGKKKRMIA